MISMVRAHGLDPGPTQRPLSAGLLAGLAGALPAGALPVLSGPSNMVWQREIHSYDVTMFCRALCLLRVRAPSACAAQ